MKNTIKNQAYVQRGMSFWGTMVVLAAVILLGTVGMKVMPAYLEFTSLET